MSKLCNREKKKKTQEEACVSVPDVHAYIRTACGYHVQSYSWVDTRDCHTHTHTHFSARRRACLLRREALGNLPVPDLTQTDRR